MYIIGTATISPPAVVNCARGGLYNEQDLADALTSGKVAAAAADVVTVEPMKVDNPLLTAPNLCLTPQFYEFGTNITLLFLH